MLIVVSFTPEHLTWVEKIVNSII